MAGVRNQVAMFTVSLTPGAKTFVLEIQGAASPTEDWHTVSVVTEATTELRPDGTRDTTYAEVPMFPVMRVSLTAVQSGVLNFDVSVRE